MSDQALTMFGVVTAIDDAMRTALGPSSRAVMRKAGSDLSISLRPELRAEHRPEEASRIVADAMSALEKFGDVSVASVEDERIELRLTGCVFGQLGGADGAVCGNMPLCSLAFGFVEESLRRTTGQRYRASEASGDGPGACREVYEVI